MGTTSSIERQRALAWIARQLRWERTLERLRQEQPAAHDEQAAA